MKKETYTALDARGKEIHIGDKIVRATISLGVIKWSEHTVTGICAKKIRISADRGDINATPGNCVVINDQ